MYTLLQKRLINLHTCNYIQDYGRGGDITLIEMGRKVAYKSFPTPNDKAKIDSYWEKKSQKRAGRKSQVKEQYDEENPALEESIQINDDSPEDSDTSENWKVEILCHKRKSV